MKPWPRHLIFVGPMGAGKSSIGRAAAALLRLPFVDVDHMVENAAGKSISQIFSKCGEEAFRKAETLALQRLLIIPDAVVATGGGAVIRPENWDYMQASGVVVRLLISPCEAFRRTAHDQNRPLLAAPDRLERITRLMEEREPFYALAAHTVDAEALSIADAAREAIAHYLAWCGAC